MEKPYCHTVSSVCRGSISLLHFFPLSPLLPPSPLPSPSLPPPFPPSFPPPSFPLSLPPSFPPSLLPTSMRALGMTYWLSQRGKDFQTMLEDTYNLPTYAVFIVVAIATIVIGLVLGGVSLNHFTVRVSLRPIFIPCVLYSILFVWFGITALSSLYHGTSDKGHLCIKDTFLCTSLQCTCI